MRPVGVDRLGLEQPGDRGGVAAVGAPAVARSPRQGLVDLLRLGPRSAQDSRLMPRVEPAAQVRVEWPRGTTCRCPAARARAPARAGRAPVWRKSSNGAEWPAQTACLGIRSPVKCLIQSSANLCGFEEVCRGSALIIRWIVVIITQGFQDSAGGRVVELDRGVFFDSAGPAFDPAPDFRHRSALCPAPTVPEAPARDTRSITARHRHQCRPDLFASGRSAPLIGQFDRGLTHRVYPRRRRRGRLDETRARREVPAPRLARPWPSCKAREATCGTVSQLEPKQRDLDGSRCFCRSDQ